MDITTAREWLTTDEQRIIKQAFDGIMSCDPWDYNDSRIEYWNTVRSLRDRVLRQFELEEE